MDVRGNAVSAKSANDSPQISATASEIRALFEAARATEQESDRLMRDGLMCMVAAVSLLVIVAVCTLTNSNQASGTTVPSFRHLFSDTSTSAKNTAESMTRARIGDVSSMMGLQNNLAQPSSMFNTLREFRDRVPNAVVATLAGR